MDETKRCTKCGITKSLSEFKLQKRKLGSYPTSWCRTCLNEKSRLFMEARKDEPAVIEARRRRDAERWQKTKADPVLHAQAKARARAYVARPDVKEKTAEYLREYNTRPGVKEKTAEHSRKWRIANPERKKEIARASHEQRRGTEEHKLQRIVVQGERRWRMYNQGEGRFTAMQARLSIAFWNGCCAYCGEVTNASARPQRAFDHVVPLSRGGGHGPGNIVVCCKTCNDRKNRNALPESMMEAMSIQLDAFVALLPPEAEWSRQSAVPYAIQRVIFEVEGRIRGKGVAIGTGW